MAIHRLTADTNYLWESPIPKEILMPIVHIVNEIGFMIPRFIHKEYGKMCFFLTDNPQQHGSPLQLGFLFYIDTEKILNAHEEEQRNVIISLIKEGLIKMGETHGWSEEHIADLFKKVK